MYEKLLINRNFSLLLFSRFISQIGDYLFLPAILWLAIDSEQGSNTWLGIISFVIIIPPFLGFLFGIIIDNKSKRKILINTDVIRFILCLILILNQATLSSFIMITIIIFIIESAGQMFNISSQSIIPNITSEEEYLKANSYLTITSNITAIIGFSLGGVFIAFFGFTLVILINAITFLISALLLVFLRTENTVYNNNNDNNNGTAHRKMFLKAFSNTLIDGLKITFKNSFLSILLIVAFIINMFSVSLEMIITVWTHEIIQVGSQGFGILLSSILIGSLFGGWFVNFKIIKQFPVEYLVSLSTAFFGVSFILVSFFPNFSIDLILFFLAGIFLAINSINFTTIIMKNTDKQSMGKVFGIIQTIIRGGQPLGIALVTWLLGWIEVPYIILGIGIVIGLSGLALFIVSLIHVSSKKRWTKLPKEELS
ncbi:MFS transporter [Saliterribacillus persicus]|uniref:MFS transporter n=1 Tax=Saliterribacillus persicus TaxID=930114 RepID=A0A368Y4F2_9BACI|nr:MFS transporter [Saliterribacillus persicus]RCW73104.1 MFS transporter [Saliterribacillus persicus]